MLRGRKRVAASRPNRRSSQAVDIDRLSYMANQIARNFAALGEEVAIALTAQHIRDYWDPRMKAALLGGDRSGLNPIAAAAFQAIGGAA